MDSKQAASENSKGVAFQAQLLAHIPYLLWVLSDACTLQWANPLFAKFLGEPVDALKDRPLAELLDPEECITHCKLNEQSLTEEASIESREWIISAQQGPRLLAIRRTCLFENDGKQCGLLCTASDITEQHFLQQRLEQSEANFRAFLESLGEMVMVSDEAGRLLYANARVSEKLGYSSEELRTKNVLEFHPANVHKEARANLKEMVEGKRETCPLPVLHKDGHVLPVEIRVCRGVWNGKACLLSLIKDIGQEQQALQKFDRLFRNNPTPMVLSTVPEKRIVEINDALSDLLGYSAEEMIGKTPEELDLMVDFEPLLAAAMHVMQHGRVQDVDLVLRAKDGHHIDSLFFAEVVESQGQPFFLAAMVDITARKEADRRRDSRIRQLSEELAEMKGLHGILPICASCKCVRGDDGVWEQIDSYLTRHTDLLFSHGLCPDCTRAYSEKLEMDLSQRGSTGS